MIRNMLQAVSKMLITSKEEKVVCARIIIDEIIDSFSGGEESIPLKPPKKPLGKYEDPVVGVKHGKLVEIKNVPLDGLVELDGVKMTHKDAIGKSFQNINILWRP